MMVGRGVLFSGRGRKEDSFPPLLHHRTSSLDDLCKLSWLADCGGGCLNPHNPLPGNFSRCYFCSSSTLLWQQLLKPGSWSGAHLCIYPSGAVLASSVALLDLHYCGVSWHLETHEFFLFSSFASTELGILGVPCRTFWPICLEYLSSINLWGILPST